MPTLKSLIFRRLSADTDLTSLLTTYAKSPAIFDVQAPDDVQAGWGGNSQYPRIEVILDMQANPARQSNGTLNITVYTERTSMIILEIVAQVKRALLDVLMVPDDGSGPYAFGWQTTASFNVPGKQIIGQTMIFDVIEYPSQVTTMPDPIMAITAWLKEFYPDAVILDHDDLEEYMVATDEHPIIYAQLVNQVEVDGHLMNTTAWMDCTIAVHILCANHAVKLKISAAIQQALATQEFIRMVDEDGAKPPMNIKSVQFNQQADYLRTGQISVIANYGVLKRGHKPLKLKKVEETFHSLNAEGRNHENGKYEIQVRLGRW